ncbi:transposase [Methylotenera sp.]|uniref:REP-associated tyrosine transposase n=1 Tax=Methylotenera sp. TaxID=2051956 RepID=UPI00248A27B6|nr:transposase [Methylotenera sp.]MDI1360812.1 transposase [Methylotenera sp.]
MNSIAKPPQLKHQKDLRKGRYSQTNQIYHITTTTKNRRPIFSDFASARKLIGTIRKSDDLNFTKTIAFVIMPDHMHWLMQLENHATQQRIIRSMKSQSAKAIGMPTWQTGKLAILAITITQFVKMKIFKM